MDVENIQLVTLGVVSRIILGKFDESMSAGEYGRLCNDQLYELRWPSRVSLKVSDVVPASG